MNSPLPSYVEDRLRRPVPDGVPVVPFSTPVLSFGPVRTASVATLGLNPSLKEFWGNGHLLAGRERRLADLQHLGKPTLVHASPASLKAVVADCDAYFDVNPYWGWFKPLEDIVQGLDASYSDGSACHLDLVQWATDPVWNKLPSAQRSTLIEADAEFLRQQLLRENVRIVLMNGRTVLNAVHGRLAELAPCGEVTNGRLTAKLYDGIADGVRYLGWSCNLQSQHGALALKGQLRDAMVALTELAPERTSEVFIERGTAVQSKDELHKVLRRWLRDTDEPTIGDIRRFGGKAWLYVEFPSTTVVLNSDTKRAAIQAYLDATLAHGDDLRWEVVANRNGKVNKVLYGDLADAPGWYCYTLSPLTAPMSL